MKRFATTLICAAICVWAFNAEAQQPLSADAVAKRVAEAHNVEVLRVEPLESDGRAAYLVTVMNAGGNFNEAFRVTRLVVDAASGDLISQFQHGAAGYSLSGGRANYSTSESDGTAIRRHSLSR